MLAPSSPQPFYKRVLGALTTALPRARPFEEMGVSGTPVFSGYILNRERSSQWSGNQKYTTISDMAVNTSIIATGVHSFLDLVAHPQWSFVPADESPEAQEAAEFVEDVLTSMATSWSRTVRRAGVFRFYGFGVQEWTAVRRRDGRIGLSSLEARPQHTIEQWAVADDGAVEGVFQRSPRDGSLLGIPRSKFLYLVDDTLTDSPEGTALFRHLAEPWERLKVYYELEARGYERDLRGTPIGRIPYTYIREAVRSGEMTQEQANTLIKGIEDFVQLQVKQSNTYATMDSIPYFSQAQDGAKVASMQQWGIELLQGGAAGMAEIAEAIKRTQFEMARLLTCDHLLMGEAAGNRALSEDKSRNLYLVANATLGGIASAMEHDVIAPLCDLNGIAEELRPTCEVEDVSFKSAEAVAETLSKMAQAGAMLSPDDPVIEDVRGLLGVSPPAPVSPEMLGIETAPPEDTGQPGDETPPAGAPPAGEAPAGEEFTRAVAFDVADEGTSPTIVDEPTPRRRSVPRRKLTRSM